VASEQALTLAKLDKTIKAVEDTEFKQAHRRGIDYHALLFDEVTQSAYVRGLGKPVSVGRKGPGLLMLEALAQVPLLTVIVQQG